MNATVLSRRHGLLPTGILLAIGLYLWADPIGELRIQQTEHAIEADPNSGAGLASATGSNGLTGARQIDRAALSALLRRAGPKMRETAVFSVLVDAEGRAFDVRVVDASLAPDSAKAAVQAIEGQRLFEPVFGASAVRTIVGPVTW